MPITYGDIPWPPPYCRKPAELYDTWGAWYSGEPDELQRVYGSGGTFVGAGDSRYVSRPSQWQGGVVGALARFWWGRPTNVAQPTAKLHLPAAGDLSMYAADLLFGAFPDITVGEPGTEQAADGTVLVTPNPLGERWDGIADEIGFTNRMLEAAELCSAYGGVYLRATVPAEVDGYRPAEAVLVEAIPPEAAVPEWRNGFLVAVTFWRELYRKTGSGGESHKDTVLRHLERHEPGMVFHALYQGTGDKLGQPIDLTAHPATADFLEAAETGATGLAVEYVPNMRPNRLIKGTPLGRSDYSGAEGFMDALDETWSSWMRDIRIAKGRVIVPEIYLESLGPGKGAAFDAEREVWAGINVLPSAQGGSTITVNQFAIRVNEHRDTAAAQLRQIWRTAGYSVGENGEEPEAQGAATATEVVARGARTMATRKRKIGYWAPAMRRLVRTMLEMDAAAGFSDAKIGDDPITLEWPATVAPDPESVARTAQLLSQAAAASTKTLVELVHPDWSDPEVAAEVALIKGAVSSPDDFPIE